MKSIRGRLLLVLVGGATLLVGSGAWVLDNRVRAELQRTLDVALVSRATALARVLAVDPTAVSGEDELSLASALEVTSRPFFFQVWRDDGTLLGGAPSLEGAALPRVGAGGEGPNFVDVGRLPNGRAGRAVVVLSTVRGARAGAATETPAVLPAGTRLTVVVATDRTELEATLGGLRRAGLLILVGVFVLGVLVVAQVLRVGLAPLSAFAEQARALDERSLHVRFDVPRLPAELRPIQDRLNELLARLEAAFDHEQRFTSSLAHELRTPIAELRTLAEVALRADPRAASSGDYQAFLTGVERIQSLVQALLLLRRSETGQLDLGADDVDLGTLVEDVLDDHEAAARHRQLVVETELEEAIRLRTNRAMLRSIVDNLLRNALEYAPAGTKVRIACTRTGTGFTFSIENSAPGLDAQAVERLFEPRRGGQVRRDGEHLGLGLALCNSLARLLELQLRASLTDGDRLVFSVVGPVARGEPPRG